MPTILDYVTCDRYPSLPVLDRPAVRSPSGKDYHHHLDPENPDGMPCDGRLRGGRA
jgi:hypothetical protein